MLPESLVVNPRPSEQVPGRGPGKAAGALDSGAIGGDENAAGRRPGAAQPGHGGLPTGSEVVGVEGRAGGGHHGIAAGPTG